MKKYLLPVLSSLVLFAACAGEGVSPEPNLVPATMTTESVAPRAEDSEATLLPARDDSRRRRTRRDHNRFLPGGQN